MPFPTSSTLDFIEKIKDIRNFLITLNTTNNTDALVKFENQLTLDELENCLVSSSDPEELGENLKKFLANRWERIRNDSSASYTQQPTNKVNLLCLELANILSPLPSDPKEYSNLEFGKGPYFLLMPSLTVHQTVSYDDNIHQLKLHEFVLSDNGELYIPIMSSLELAFTNDTGEMSHLMMDPGSDALLPPMLTSTELARVAEHSQGVKEYYQLIQKYNQKRLHDSNLGNELDKLAQALRAGNMHHGGQDENAGTAANIGIFKFNEFWNDYPEAKKKWALEHYTNPSLEEALGRLMRPADTNYLDTTYCVEVIESYFISPLVEKIRSEENDLEELKGQIIRKQKTVEEAMKKPDYPVLLSHDTVKQPQVLRQIFELKEEQRKEVFAHTLSQSALLYALKKEPLALPQFFDLLDETEKENAISARFVNDATALMIAARAGGKESVELLLGLGADVNAQDATRDTALHWAAANGHNEVVKILLENGANINCTGPDENTPLHYAVTQGHAAVVDTLLDRGADITAKIHRYVSSYGLWGRQRLQYQNAFDLAREHHPELIKPLLFKANTLDHEQQSSCLERIENGNYPNVLIYAAARHPLLLDDLVAELKKQPLETIQPILSSTTDDNGKTPLVLAAGLGRDNSVRDLLELGADITASGYDRRTALHEAASNGHAGVIELLLAKDPDNKGALLECQDAQGNTPLHLAVPTGGLVVTVLLEQGADINAKNWIGENALDIARKKQDPKLIEPLLFKANTLSPDQQRLCLSNIEAGAYRNVMLYAMCEQPNAVNELLITNGKVDQCLAGHKAMDKFFDIDAHIETFNEKLKEMERKATKNHHYEPAVRTTKTLIRELKLAKAEFILAEDMSMEDKKAVFKQKCLDAAQDARPVLEQHRELGKLIASFILIILTLPISLPLLALGVFSLKTNSAQQLGSFKEDLDYLSTSDNRNLMVKA